MLVSQVLMSKSVAMRCTMHVHLFRWAVTQPLPISLKAVCHAPSLMGPCILKIYIVQTLCMWSCLLHVHRWCTANVLLLYIIFLAWVLTEFQGVGCSASSCPLLTEVSQLSAGNELLVFSVYAEVKVVPPSKARSWEQSLCLCISYSWATLG